MNFCYSSENSKFLWLKKQLFYLLYIFCSFTLLVCREKNILPNLTNSQEPEPGFFWPLWARAARKKIPGAGAAWENNQEPVTLEKKKSGTVAGAA